MSRSQGAGALLFGCAILWLRPAPLASQSALERPPNLTGGWVAPLGTVQFDFVHRFEARPAPERKVTNFPSFVFAGGLPAHTTVGVFYSTNSTLVPRYPNEWEFFGRVAPLRQADGKPLDLGVEGGYNLAAKGLVGELSLARRAGRVRLLAVVAALACFSERSSSPPDAGLTCARAGQPPGPDTAFVIISGFAFSPVQVTVASGTRVVWINCEPAGTPGHTTTVDAGAWDSPTLLPGEVFSVVPAAGTFDYHCRPHPFMQGRVVVQ